MTEIETYLQDFPIKQLNISDTAGHYFICFSYGSIVLNSPITNSRTVRFDPSLFNQSPDRVLTRLYETIELNDSIGEYKFLTEFLTGTRREGMSQWINEAKAWITENAVLVEKEKQLEIERLKRELQDAVPITVRNAVQRSVQKDEVIVIGRIKKRSSPVLATRKDLEYTAYDLELEDIDESSSSIPVNNLPAGDYENGDIIRIKGIIIQRVRRRKSYKEIDGLDFRIEQPKFIPSDPLERIRPLVFEIYQREYPNEIEFAEVLEEICDKDPIAAEIIDPHNTHYFAVSETIPKRLRKICCQRRPSDDGYLERGTKQTPLTFRWVKNEGEKKAKKKAEDENKA
jgi:hypothetical protein